MFFSILADLVQASHLGFLAFTLLGQLLIFVGVLRKWQWVRNPWFRCIHLGCIVFVALEYAVHMKCPLTTLEELLRDWGGEASNSDASFIAQLMDKLLFYPDLDWDHWAFGVGYAAFALLVLATFVLAPPRFRRKEPVPGNDATPTAAAPGVNGAGTTPPPLTDSQVATSR
jgi:Protein of Unknown function (DUF2784)